MRLGAPRLGNQGLEFAPSRSLRPQWRLTYITKTCKAHEAAVCPSQKHASICFCWSGIKQFGHALSEISLSLWCAKGVPFRASNHLDTGTQHMGRTASVSSLIEVTGSRRKIHKWLQLFALIILMKPVCKNWELVLLELQLPHLGHA